MYRASDITPALPTQSYGTLELLLEYSPPRTLSHLVPLDGETGSNENALGNFLKDKVQCLSDILSDIWQDINRRNTLSAKIATGIEQHYSYLKTKLFELYSWEFGKIRSVDGRRLGLEKQLDALNTEKRREEVQCWQDIAALKNEFRTWFKQYCDLAQRVRLILPDKAKQTFGRGKHEPRRITITDGFEMGF